MSPDERRVAGGIGGGAAVGGLLSNPIVGGSGRTITKIVGAGLGAVPGGSLASNSG